MGKEIKSIQDLPGIGAAGAEKLLAAGYKELESIAVASAKELIEAAGLGEGTAEKAIKAARDALEMGYQTADILAEKRKLVGRLTTGSSEIDELIGGGIESLPYEEEILIINKQGLLERQPIGKIAEESIEKSREKSESNGTTVSYENPLELMAPAFDDNYFMKNKKITAFVKHKRTEKILNVRLSRGKTVSVTEGHSLFKLDGLKIVPAKAKELKPGDFGVVPKKINYKSDLEEINVIECIANTPKEWLRRVFIKTPEYADFLFKNYETRIKEIIKEENIKERFFFDWRYEKILPVSVIQKLPKEAFSTKTLNEFGAEIGIEHSIKAVFPVNEETMWLLGFCFAEAGTNVNEPQISISQQIGNVLVLQKTMGIFSKSMSVEIPIFKSERENSSQMKITTGNTALWVFFNAIGLGNYCQNKRAPNFLFGLKKEKITAFLKGYFEGDGVVKRGTVGWTTSSKEMAKDIVLLLTLLGETPVHNISRNKNPKFYPMHIIYAFGVKNIAELGTKQEENNEMNIIPIKKEIITLCKEHKLSFKLNKYYSQACSNQPTVKTIKKFCTEFKRITGKETIQIKQIEKLLESDLRFEKILSVTETEQQPEFVYDIQTRDNPVTDNFVTGGIICAHNTQSITEIYGKFASSKTQWCFQTAVTVQLPKEKGGLEGNCLYIDSENSFRPERIEAIAKYLKLDVEEVMKNIFVARAYNSDHQMLLAEKAAELIEEKNIKLVIVDSLTAQFRSEFVGRGTLSERQQKLNKHMRALQKLAEMNNVVVLVTNQVMQRPDILFGDPTAPIGGEIVAHASKTRLYLRKSKDNKRVAKLVDSPSLPDGEAIYQITENGIEDV